MFNEKVDRGQFCGKVPELLHKFFLGAHGIDLFLNITYVIFK